MIKQFVFVIVFFLLEKHNIIIHCTRVIMNFVTLIQNAFHDRNTLNYIKYTLYQIDTLKTVFVKYKFQNIVRDKNDENETHFNLFKFYIIIYYVTFVRLYDSVQNFDTIYKKTIINSC